MITLRCSCGAKVRTADQNAGKVLKCPKCASSIHVPESHDVMMSQSAFQELENEEYDEYDEDNVEISPNVNLYDSMPPPPTSFSVPTATRQSNISTSVLQQAKENDVEAVATMFRQFTLEDEKIYFAEYLGMKGYFSRFSTHSFACVTDHRVATIRVSSAGELIYQDGFLECISSSIVYQPSKWGLYVCLGILFFFAAIVLVTVFVNAPIINALIFVVPFAVVVFLLALLFKHCYYAVKKSGIVFSIQEGVPVYIFTNQKLIGRASQILRESTRYRDVRLRKT